MDKYVRLEHEYNLLKDDYNSTSSENQTLKLQATHLKLTRNINERGS